MKPALVVTLVLLLIFSSQALPSSAQPAFAPQQPLHLRFEGLVNSVAGNNWQVRDVRVVVDKQTLFVEGLGKAEVGAWVLVMATFNANGSIHATKIQTLVPASQVAGGIESAGPLEAVNADNTWVVGGERFIVDPNTRRPANPILGILVRVIATQVGGHLHANIIDPVSAVPGSAPVEYTGTIESMTPTVWIIDNRSVVLTRNTGLQGATAAVGKLADVQALLLADGKLLAQTIFVQALPAPRMIGALVTDLVPGDEGARTLNLLVFPAQPWADPVATSIQLTGKTFVDQSRALLGAGQWVDIRAQPKADGTFQVDSVSVEQPARVHLPGAAQPHSLKKMDGTGWWSVGGRPVWAETGSSVVRSLPTGAQPLNEGLLLGNGVILASRLQTPDGVVPAEPAGNSQILDVSASWSAPTPIVSSLAYAKRPALITTPDGVKRAVWESSGYLYYAYAQGNGAWSDAEKVAYGTSPAMVGDPTGTLHLVYVNNWRGNNEIFYVKWQNGQWGLSYNISNTASGDSEQPDIAYSPDGSLQATWSEGYSPAQSLIYLGNLIGSGTIWGSRPVASATGAVPVVSVASDGLVYIAWQDNTSATSTNTGNYDVWITQYRRVNGSNQWAIPVNLSDNPSATSIGASIVAGSDGLAHVVWVENGSQIKYAFGRDTRWQMPVAVSQNTSSARGPRIAFDHGALLNVIWDESDKIMTAGASQNDGPWTAPAVVVGQSTNNFRDVALDALNTGGFVVSWVQSAGAGQVGIYESSRPTALTKSNWLPLILR